MTPIKAADYRSVRDFCAAVRNVAAQGNRAHALEMIAAFVLDVIAHHSSFATVFSSPELDELCLELGRPVPYGTTDVRDQDRAVYLVTALHRTGGHSRVLLDLMQADPATKVTVLISNTNHLLQQSDVEELLKDQGADVEVAPRGNLAEGLVWLQGRLMELWPARTYMLQHHFDSVCIAAAQPELCGTLFYYHHCDHALALGVHMPHAMHVDFNGKGSHHCRTVKGVRNGIFWPLTASVPVHRVEQRFLQRGHLTTCTAGGFEKFSNARLIERIPYLYDYIQLLPSMLQASQGTHIHIGHLDDPMLESINAGLAALGTPSQRFIYIPHVASLADALVAHNVDVYVGSFPLGGGRALIEVMGAGLPLVVHSNYRTNFFSDVGEAYPGALSWRTPEELLGHLGAFTETVLRDHARRARAHYESHHAPERLHAAVKATLAGQPPLPPDPPVYHPDPLQFWLDTRATESGSVGEDAPAVSPVDQVHTKDLASELLRRMVMKGYYLSQRHLRRRH